VGSRLTVRVKIFHIPETSYSCTGKRAFVALAKCIVSLESETWGNFEATWEYGSHQCAKK
jgi:hypothetical protein